MNDESHPAAPSCPEPLLLTATETARLLGMSRASLWSLHSAGRIPLPRKLGKRLTRWDRRELEAWIAADCPPRIKWQAMRKQ